MISTILSSFRVAEIRKKLLFTAALLANSHEIDRGSRDRRVGAEDAVKGEPETGRAAPCDHRVDAECRHLEARRERRDRGESIGDRSEQQVAATGADTSSEHDELGWRKQR